MKVEKVYAEDGHCVGDEYIDMSGLHMDTVKAIIHLIYLDESTKLLLDILARDEECEEAQPSSQAPKKV